MINLTPIAKKIQERLRQKMDAVGRDAPYFPGDKTNKLTQDKMMTRTTFIKMVSGQKNPVTLMAGELKEGGLVAGGSDEIYGPRAGLDNKAGRPMPGIKSLSAQFMGGMKAHREATISWVCWSFEDLERLIPHFLAHGKSIMIQWGWIYDDKSLSKIRSYQDANGITKDAYNNNHHSDVIDADGDYDMMTGVIKNFSFTARQDGGFDCETIITSVGINLMSSTQGTPSSLDPIITFNLQEQEGKDKKQFKIKQAEKNAYKEGDSNRLVRLNSTVSLKIFLNNINSYINLQMPPNHKTYKSGQESKRKSKSDGKDYYKITWDSNKFLKLEEGSVKKFGDEEKQISENKDYYVRWGWFEDNVLSKFLTVTSQDNIISSFRSVERELDPITLKPIKNDKGNPIFVSTKIKSHPVMQTLSLNEYILPGKFYPQEEIVEEALGKNFTFPGDKDVLLSLANIVNDENNFSRFDVYTNQPPKEGPQGQKIKKNSKGKFFYYIDENDKSHGVNLVQVEESPSNYGYMRNMLINTKLIKKAFGIGGGFGVEKINIFESLETMFSLLNQRIAYWDFELVSDEIDTNRLKIIDATTTWIDFGKPPNDSKTFFQGNEIIGKPGIFYFPVWNQNSIVKNQSLEAKIPNSMQLAAMYGANLDSTRDYSKSSFQEVIGTAAGGLNNEEKDENKKGISLAFTSENKSNLGTVSGEASEELSNKGDDIKTFILKNPTLLEKNLQDDLNDIAEKMLATGGGNEQFFDPSKPPPFFNVMSSLERKQVLENMSYVDVGPLQGQSEDFRQLFSSRFDKDGNMRNQYVGTIDVLISMWDRDNNNKDNRPLKMLFDLGLELDGIGGIVPGNSFHSNYLPNKYKEKCVFQMTNVEHTIDSSTWTTNVTGMMRSTIGYIFKDKKVDDELDELTDNLLEKTSEGIKQKPKTNIEQIAQPSPNIPKGTVRKNYVEIDNSEIVEGAVGGTEINSEVGNFSYGELYNVIQPFGWATQTDISTGVVSDLSIEQLQELGAKPAEKNND